MCFSIKLAGIAVTCLLLLGFGASESKAANLILNGDFEAGNPVNEDGTVEILNWTKDATASLYDNVYTQRYAVRNTQVVDVTPFGTSGGGLYQDISTVMGASYLISVEVFDYAANNIGVSLRVNGSQVAVLDAGAAWQTFTHTFTATAATTRIGFKDISGVDANNWIDNVSVTLIPEPRMPGLLLGSAILLLLFRRRMKFRP